MSWKKNAFSYLIWIIYTLITGTALASLGSMFCQEAGYAAGWGILAAAMYMGAVGGIVFLLYRTGGGRLKFMERNHTLLLAAESVLVAGFLVLGMVLRVLGAEQAQDASGYFGMAEVAAGRPMPQMVHGAAHFYVRLLHGIFLLFGNRYMAGIWLQIVLQLMASVVLYFVMRKLAGVVAALVVFSFCMCAPYMVQSGLTFSPEMLYFLLLAIAAGLMVWAFGGRLNLPAFVWMGALSALCCYMDIHGVLVLILAVALAFSECAGEIVPGGRLKAVGCCLLAAVFGVLAFFWTDAFISGKNFWKVARAWFDLYQGEAFQLPFAVGTAGTEWEVFLLFGMIAFGVFGFWCDRDHDYLSPYVISASVMMLGSCFGIFTEEMPGFYALYLMFAMLAGVSAQQCICRAAQPGDVPADAREDLAREEKTESREDAAVSDREEAFLSREEALKAELQEGAGEAEVIEKKKVRYLENPLPLPKKHVKRVMDYSIQTSGEDDFDYQVGENDDFDV